MTLHLHLADEQATAELAGALAVAAPPGAMVHLQGDLGAGKSTLARAWLRALGVTGPVRSPTYTLVERYLLASGRDAVHLDLYRIGDAAELDFLGLDDIEPVLWLVEWPDRAGPGLPPADLAVQLAVAGDGRSARLAPMSAAGHAWLEAVSLPMRFAATT